MESGRRGNLTLIVILEESEHSKTPRARPELDSGTTKNLRVGHFLLLPVIPCPVPCLTRD